MVRAMRYIDFPREDFVAESHAIMEATSGGITRNDLLNMDFDEYWEWVQSALRWQKAQSDSLK
jgi:DNA-binding transcriptional regulator YdaS (Cro superfamily)